MEFRNWSVYYLYVIWNILLYVSYLSWRLKTNDLLKQMQVTSLRKLERHLVTFQCLFLDKNWICVGYSFQLLLWNISGVASTCFWRGWEIGSITSCTFSWKQIPLNLIGFCSEQVYKRLGYVYPLTDSTDISNKNKHYKWGFFVLHAPVRFVSKNAISLTSGVIFCLATVLKKQLNHVHIEYCQFLSLLVIKHVAPVLHIFFKNKFYLE